MELLNNLENMKNQQILNQSKKTEIKQNHNYQRDLDKILAGLTSISKPTLLLHACCGPCSSYVLEYLVKHFQITVFYYNPNIYPQEEYIRRFTELQELYKKFPPALEGNVQVIEKTYIQMIFTKQLILKIILNWQMNQKKVKNQKMNLLNQKKILKFNLLQIYLREWYMNYNISIPFFILVNIIIFLFRK